MADKNLSGVTTRDLDTTNDNARSRAIANRSNIATLYTDQFRADRNSLRRGGEIRNATAGAVPSASGSVTQSYDNSLPDSFKAVLDSLKNAELKGGETTDPGDPTKDLKTPTGGGNGYAGSAIGQGALPQGPIDFGNTSQPATPSGMVWTDHNGDVTDAPVDTTMTLSGKNDPNNLTPGSWSRTATMHWRNDLKDQQIGWLYTDANGKRKFSTDMKGNHRSGNGINFGRDVSLDNYTAWKKGLAGWYQDSRKQWVMPNGKKPEYSDLTAFHKTSPLI